MHVDVFGHMLGHVAAVTNMLTNMLHVTPLRPAQTYAKCHPLASPFRKWWPFKFRHLTQLILRGIRQLVPAISQRNSQRLSVLQKKISQNFPLELKTWMRRINFDLAIDPLRSTLASEIQILNGYRSRGLQADQLHCGVNLLQIELSCGSLFSRPLEQWYLPAICQTRIRRALAQKFCLFLFRTSACRWTCRNRKFDGRLLELRIKLSLWFRCVLPIW